MVVTEQTGWTFNGYMQWSTPEGPLQDDLVEVEPRLTGTKRGL